MNNRITTAIVIIILLIVGMFYLEWLHTQRENKMNEQITTLQLDNQRLKSEVNSKGDTILFQQAIVTSSQQAIHSLTDSIFSLTKKHDRQIKDILSYFKGITNTKIDSFPIPYKDTIAMKKFEDSIIQRCGQVIQYIIDSTITVPRKVEEINKNFFFTGTITKKQFTIDSLSIPDTLQLRFVEKGGFLKKRTAEVQFFHSNPLISTTQANSVVYKPPKNRQLFLKTLFFGVGVFLGTKFK